MADRPGSLLRSWLQRQLSEADYGWLMEQLEKLRQDPGDRSLHIALGMAPRRIGKADLELSEADLAAAEAARPGWDPRGWSLDEAARILILLETGSANTSFAERFTQLCRTSDVGEAIALYRGLPLYAEPESLEPQAAEGVRSNMRAVFEAVAHENPYPREVFDEDRWNQMVLKALFVDSTLAPIQGLEARANPKLAAILIDYAHERWAAGRKVSPELWRCVGPFAVGALLPNLKRVLDEGDATERRAAVLALSASPDAEAKALLSDATDIVAEVESGELTWDRLAADG